MLSIHLFLKKLNKTCSKKEKVIGYYLSNRRTRILIVIGNDEKTYNLYDKT